MEIINKISLKNFKCYKETSFDLKTLNVLSGINSSGKSTLIQSLLLLRQSYDTGKLAEGLLLKSSLIDLGTIQDLLNSKVNQEPIIELVVDFGGEKIVGRHTLSSGDIQSDFLKFDDRCSVPNNCNLFTEGFNYISSDRIGPQKVYEKSYSLVKHSRSVGLRGELFAHMYQLNKQQKTILEDTLENDFAKWMEEVSLGFAIETISDSEKSQMVDLMFRKSGDSKQYKAINVGFGLSYIAPVIVSLLMAKPGDLLIIESPEAHLHPKGQRKMGELLATVGAKGVQLIIETHSDHVINGIRLSVKKSVISPEIINFLHFYRDETNNHEVENVEVLEDGQLSHWPDGFFDEWDNALFELLRR